MIEPYYSDDGVTLYHANMLQLTYELPDVDACVTDPPYGNTTLVWDSWPTGWPLAVAHKTNSLWCFGSLTMFFARLQEIVEVGWKMSQDVVWEKHNGSGFQNDRFRRVHEHAIHWYRGGWEGVYHQTQFTNDATKRTVRRKQKPTHMGEIGTGVYTSVDGGPRLQTSVIRARSMHGRAIHPTEKPAAILAPLIEYSVPAGGLVLDPFAGSGSTLLTARSLGRRAIGIELHEPYCEAAAKRLSEPDLFAGVLASTAEDGTP